MPEEKPQELPVSIDQIEIPKLRKGYKLDKTIHKKKKFRMKDMGSSDEEIESDDERHERLKELILSRRENILRERGIEPGAFLQQLREQRIASIRSKYSDQFGDKPDGGSPSHYIDVPMFRNLQDHAQFQAHNSGSDSEETDILDSFHDSFDDYVVQRGFTAHGDEEEDDGSDNNDMDDSEDDMDDGTINFF